MDITQLTVFLALDLIIQEIRVTLIIETIIETIMDSTIIEEDIVVDTITTIIGITDIN
jgi:hypothetical protein